MGFFEYSEEETGYLKSRDKRLGEVIDKTGHIYRQTDDNLFSSVIHHIIGQQISTKAQATIWQRIKTAYGEVTPGIIYNSSVNELQLSGITFRKAGYIKDFSEKVINGEFNLNAVAKMPDKEAVAALSGLKGVGVWTAEMILLFCLERKDILSYSDLAIHRGMGMVYHHKKIDKKLFEKYRKRFSPYGSIASLYFWAAAGSKVPGIS
ncbi:MAG: DNA-3-methyladenine glycosylase 2 family protein [Lachnospiraceae bacterium]